jgi:hypothetical protein
MLIPKSVTKSQALGSSAFRNDLVKTIVAAHKREATFNDFRSKTNNSDYEDDVN